MIRENIKSNKSGKMTLDKLAAMVAKGFGGVDERFKHIEEKIDGVETRLSSRIEGTNNRIDNHASNKVSYDNFNPLVKRVEKLEKAK